MLNHFRELHKAMPSIQHEVDLWWEPIMSRDSCKETEVWMREDPTYTGDNCCLLCEACLLEAQLGGDPPPVPTGRTTMEAKPTCLSSPRSGRTECYNHALAALKSI